MTASAALRAMRASLAARLCPDCEQHDRGELVRLCIGDDVEELHERDAACATCGTTRNAVTVTVTLADEPPSSSRERVGRPGSPGDGSETTHAVSAPPGPSLPQHAWRAMVADVTPDERTLAIQHAAQQRPTMPPVRRAPGHVPVDPSSPPPAVLDPGDDEPPDPPPVNRRFRWVPAPQHARGWDTVSTSAPRPGGTTWVEDDRPEQWRPVAP